MRDERACAPRLVRLPDRDERRRAGRQGGEYRVGKHLKRRRDSAKRAAARMVVIGESILLLRDDLAESLTTDHIT